MGPRVDGQASDRHTLPPHLLLGQEVRALDPSCFELDRLLARINAALDTGDKRAFRHWSGRLKALRRDRRMAATRWARTYNVEV